MRDTSLALSLATFLVICRLRVTLAQFDGPLQRPIHRPIGPINGPFNSELDGDGSYGIGLSIRPPAIVTAGAHHPSVNNYMATGNYNTKMEGSRKETSDVKNIEKSTKDKSSDKGKDKKQSYKEDQQKEFHKGHFNNGPMLIDHYGPRPHLSELGPYRPIHSDDHDFEHHHDQDKLSKKEFKTTATTTTPAPGAWSSISNSMSDAWNRFSIFGSTGNESRSAKRTKRATIDKEPTKMQEQRETQMYSELARVKRNVADTVHNDTPLTDLAVPLIVNKPLGEVQQAQQQQQQQQLVNVAEQPAVVQQIQQQQQQQESLNVQSSHSPNDASLSTVNQQQQQQQQQLVNNDVVVPKTEISHAHDTIKTILTPATPHQYVYLKVPKHLICGSSITI